MSEKLNELSTTLLNVDVFESVRSRGVGGGNEVMMRAKSEDLESSMLGRTRNESMKWRNVESSLSWRNLIRIKIG